jgi:MoxR-like ATPase
LTIEIARGPSGPAGDELGAAEAAGRIAELEANVRRVFRGDREAVRLAVVCLVAKGHVLIEDVPGVGKTTLAQALARSLGLSFQRIQFTSDLLPSDILGVSIWNQRREAFEFVPGPIFASVVLADEINRATPRTQSALLEAMAEGQASVEGRTHALPSPFFVIATQNPVEHYGTFPLPESQLDRFMMTLHMGYPDREAERTLLADLDTRSRLERVAPALAPGELPALQEAAGAVHAAPAVLEYVLDLVAASRASDRLLVGVSPRGAEHWVRAAKALALLGGRDYCLPEDVQGVAAAVVAHRLLPRGDFEKVDRAALVGDLLRATPVR